MKKSLVVVFAVLAVVSVLVSTFIIFKSYVVEQRPVQPVVTTPYLNKLAPAQVDELYTLEFPEEDK